MNFPFPSSSPTVISIEHEALAGALGMELEDQGSSLGSSTYWLAIAKFTAVRQEELLVPPTSSDSSEDEMRCNGQTKTCSS